MNEVKYVQQQHVSPSTTCWRDVLTGYNATSKIAIAR
jgi:hypothetical protein